MSLFEEYLSLGFWLSESERLAIYKYLLRAKHRIYEADAITLLNQGILETNFANGEISYEFIEGEVRFRARRIGNKDFENFRRSIRVSNFKIIATSKLVRFFAQAETDVLRNYPILKEPDLEKRGYSMNVYPYYALDYYSNGEGKVRGLVNKLKNKDDKLLDKLLAS
jgi:hypothetical protein